MRSEKEIVTELTNARADYHAKPSDEVDTNIKALMSELSEALSEGAVVCSTCGEPPHGMHKGKGVYEVGCLADGLRSQGETAAEAVENWNDAHKAN